jgi:predicted ester cyclase
MGTPAENKALIQRFVDCLRDGDVAGAAACFDSDRYYSHFHESNLAGTWEKMKAMRRAAALSDWHSETIALLADGDYVVLHEKATATHSGSFYGLPPTGTTVTFTSTQTWRVDGDKIVEHWGGLIVTPSVWERLGGTT